MSIYGIGAAHGSLSQRLNYEFPSAAAAAAAIAAKRRRHHEY